MYSLTNLSAKIAEIQRNNLSGVLMVSGRATATPAKVSTYSLRFESGDLARLGGATEAQGIDAFIELLQIPNFAEPRWFPLNATPNWTAKPQIMRQEMTGLLSLATAPVEVPATAKAATPSLDADKAGKALMQRVRSVFINVYIGNTDADLAQTAKLHPPSTEPDAFIDACVHLLEPMLGAEAARAILSHS
jgi:hypothetical protein